VVLGFQIVLLLFGLLGVLSGYWAYRVALRNYPPSPGDHTHSFFMGGSSSSGSGSGSPRASSAPSSSSSSALMPEFVGEWWSRITGRRFHQTDGDILEKRLSGTYGSAGSYNADSDASRNASPSNVELNAMAGGGCEVSEPGYVSFADRKVLTRR